MSCWPIPSQSFRGLKENRAGGDDAIRPAFPAAGPVGLPPDGWSTYLLEPPVNVLRLTLHPDGMAPRIANLGEWRAHLLDRLGHQAITSGDPAVAALYDELAALPGGEPTSHSTEHAAADIAVALRLRHDDGELAFLSTVTTFGTATDITVSELAVESFFPADEHTATVLRHRSDSPAQ